MEKLFYLLSILIILFQMLFTCIPLGNARLSIKQLPLITGSIIILNIIVFVVSTPFIEWQDTQIAAARKRVLETIDRNSGLVALREVKQKLQDAGWIQDGKLVTEKDVYSVDLLDESAVLRSFGKQKTELLIKEFTIGFANYERARSEHTYYRFGLAPNGEWKFPQLLTHMFLHGGVMHLVGNMLFFFAFGGALEERWGRSLFTVFYIFMGFCACLPYLIKPDRLPLIGASGAISGVMGAFAACMSKTRIKVGWLTIPLAIFFLILRKKPFGIARIPAYIVLGLYFVADYSSLIASRMDKEAMGGVAYFAHVSGFFFGAFVALLWESFNPVKKKQELRNYALQPVVSNDDGDTTVSATVTESLEMMKRGETLKAHFKLKYYLVTNPHDIEAIKLMAQACKAISDNESLNSYSSRLINHYLSMGDKDAALLVYADLIGALYRYNLYPQITANNWMTICDYLRTSGRNKEAAVEYERLAAAHSNNALAVRACVQGGEAALSVFDRGQAVKLFELALNMNPPESYETRARRGLDMCQHILVSQSVK